MNVWFNTWGLAVLLNTVLLAIAWVVPKKLLTPAGYLHAWGLGVIIWGALGWRGYAVVMVYFIAGSAATRIGKAQKEAAGIAEKRSGQRGPENVWGSALVGALCALGRIALPFSGASEETVLLGSALLGIAYVASFSTKLSDTCASEIGKAYGKTTYLITTFKAVPAGTEGAVSLEGTMAGIAASAAIAAVGLLVRLISPMEVWICVIAAFVATNIESLIGATLQERFDWLTNELVNVANTLIGAGVA
ncbi:MAG: TIGR00297 family protein, partial [Cyanobacteria bacterium P01_D01_bin.128]